MKRATTVLAVFGLLLVLGVANYTIRDREQILGDGREVLLPLRPVDPRSLMQGDFMVLRYAASVFPAADALDDLPSRGAFVITLDERNVATFARVDAGGELAGNETRLAYKYIDRWGEIRLGAESFFFEEGQADRYNNARFGILRVAPDGRSVLVGLADEAASPIAGSDEKF